MRLHTSALCFLLFCVLLVEAKKKQKLDLETKDPENTQTPFAWQSPSQAIEPTQAQERSFAETLLNQTARVVSEFNAINENLQNAPFQQSDLKKILKSIKQQAHRLREDIEDEIKEQRKKAKKARGQERELAEQRKQKLAEAFDQLKSLNRLIKRNKQSEKRMRKTAHYTSKKPSSGGTKTVQTQSTTNKPMEQTDKGVSTTTAKPDNATIPAVAFGLGDGFGRHTR